MKILLILTLLTLTGCSSSQALKSVGSSTDDYKESPCACLIIPQPNIG